MSDGVRASDGSPRVDSVSRDDSVSPVDTDPREDPVASAVPRRRWFLVAVAGLVPWVVIPSGTGTSLMFSFGLVNPDPFSLVAVHRYVLVETAGLPRSLLAWPTASLLYLLAVVSTGIALVDREDRRITAGLLALAGVDVLYFASSFTSTRSGVVAVPLGVATLWLAAWVSRPASWRRY